MTPEELSQLVWELERLAGWSAVVLEDQEGDASEAELLEDLEHRLLQLASRVRGQAPPAHTFHHPMPEELDR